MKTAGEWLPTAEKSIVKITYRRSKSFRCYKTVARTVVGGTSGENR